MILVFVIVVPVAAYDWATMDPDLYYSDRSVALSNNLREEMRSIKLPDKTAVNREENWGKSQVSIDVLTRYRTEMEPVQFEHEMTDLLQKTGWIAFKSSSADPPTLTFCRGKLRAELIHEGGPGIFASDNGDYWKLQFGYWPTHSWYSEKLPQGCEN